MNGWIRTKKLKLAISIAALSVACLSPASVSAEVKDKPIASISIIKQPDRVIYDVGEEVDLFGIEVLVTFVDGETYTAREDDLMCLGFQPYQEGSQLVVAQYGEATVPFSVTVKKGTLKNLEAKLIDKDVWIGGKPLKKEDIIVEAVMDTGVRQEVTDFDYEPKYLNNGRNIITVRYGGQTKTISIEAYDNSCQSIRIETPGTSEFDVGEMFRWSGLKVIAHYLDGTEDDVTAACRVTGVNTGKPGKYFAEVRYQEKIATYPVTVVNLSYKDIDVSMHKETGRVLLYFNEREEPATIEADNVRYEDNYETGVRSYYVTYKGNTYTKDVEIPDDEMVMVGQNRIRVEVPIGISVKTNEQGNTGYIPKTELSSRGDSGIKIKVTDPNNIDFVHGLPLTINMPSTGLTEIALDIEEFQFSDGASDTFYPFNIILEVR